MPYIFDHLGGIPIGFDLEIIILDQEGYEPVIVGAAY